MKFIKRFRIYYFFILIIIYSLFCYGCNYNDTYGPSNGSNNTDNKFIDLKITPTRIINSSDKVTFMWRTNKGTQNDVYGTLKIVSKNNCTVYFCFINLDNTGTNWNTKLIGPSDFTDCNNRNEVYEVYAFFDYGGYYQSQRLSFVYGDTSTNCFQTQIKNINFEYDYMDNTTINGINYDFLDYNNTTNIGNTFYSNFVTAFSNSHTTINFDPTSAVHDQYNQLYCPTANEIGAYIALQNYCSYNKNSTTKHIL